MIQQVQTGEFHLSTGDMTTEYNQEQDKEALEATQLSENSQHSSYEEEMLSLLWSVKILWEKYQMWWLSGYETWLWTAFGGSFTANYLGDKVLPWIKKQLVTKMHKCPLLKEGQSVPRCQGAKV